MDSIGIYGSIETFRCTNCDNEVSVHFTPNIYDYFPENSKVKSSKKVRILYKSSVFTGKDITALRKLFPNLRNQPIKSINESLKEKKYIDLGEFDPTEAREFQIKAQQLGINIEIE